MKTVFERLVLCWCLLSGSLLFLIVFLTTLNIFGFTLHFIFQIFGSSFPAIAGYEDIVTVFTGVAVLGIGNSCKRASENLKDKVECKSKNIESCQKDYQKKQRS